MADAKMAALSAETVSIRVTPEILQEKSAEADKHIKTIKRQMQEIHNLVNKTKGYWQGEAADMHRQMYQILERDAEDIIRRLEEHPRDLLVIAQTYSGVELNIQETIQELPGDVIV